MFNKKAALRVVMAYLKEAGMKDIGDRDFPLRIDPKGIDKKHTWVGRKVRVNRNALGSLRKYRKEKGVVQGVYMKNRRPLGLHVLLSKGKTTNAPVKDFNFLD